MKECLFQACLFLPEQWSQDKFDELLSQLNELLIQEIPAGCVIEPGSFEEW